VRSGEVTLVINTSSTPQSIRDSFSLRRAALDTRTAYFTTLAGAAAAAEGMALSRSGAPQVTALQDFHAGDWSR
jgi:carbamoyl-phosphate synthase large subunit